MLVSFRLRHISGETLNLDLVQGYPSFRAGSYVIEAVSLV
jgi:hypothetical protein